jgi:hypothetical protein
MALGEHKRYSASDSYKKQNCQPRYSKKMQRLIAQQGKTA